MNVLSKAEKRWAAAIFETILPPNAHPKLPWSAKDVDILGFLDSYIPQLPRFVRRNFRLILFVLTWFPLFIVGRPVPVHWLSPATRERYLRRLTKSRIYLFRQMMLLMKSTAGLCYFKDERVRAALGIPYSKDQADVLKLPATATVVPRVASKLAAQTAPAAVPPWESVSASASASASATATASAPVSTPAPASARDGGRG